jgi:hypothetical protein
MDNKGWISINRKIQSHWLWEEKREFSKLEAWIDILLTVNHSEQKVMIKNTLFVVKRGESIKSLDTWAKRWNWNKSKVRRFLKVLQSDSMIVTKSESKTTRLTVCKYDSYQDIGNDNETITKRKRNADETIVTPNNNDNKDNNKNKEKKHTKIEHPTLSEFMLYAKSKIPHDYKAKRTNLILKYDSWVENGWKDGFNKPIKNWKSKLLNNLQYIKKDFNKEVRL